MASRVRVAISGGAVGGGRGALVRSSGLAGPGLAEAFAGRAPSSSQGGGASSASVWELIQSGVLPRRAPAYARRDVAPGMLAIESVAGSVTVATDGAMAPSGGELPVVEVQLDGVGSRITDGTRTLRRLEGSIELEGDGAQAAWDLLDAIRRVGLAVRVYGITPWPQLAWRIEGLDWDDGDDGMMWDSSGHLVFAAADIRLVEDEPAGLLLTGARSAQPGAAARDAVSRASSRRGSVRSSRVAVANAGSAFGG